MNAPNPDCFFVAAGRRVELKVHRCLWSGAHPENSLSAIAECARERVVRVEIDVQMLREREWLVFHDERFDADTDSRGRVRDVTPARATRVRFKRSDERLPLLSDVVALLAREEYPRIVELDLKDEAPLPWRRVEELARMVGPVRERVLIGGSADWNIRRLLEVDPAIPVSLNPHAYIDYGQRDSGLPRGAYGYRDAHPLARRRLTSVGEYLRDRLGGVMRLVPGAREAHVRLRMFERMLDDGVSDAADIFHDLGILVDAWTLDAGTARWRARLARAAAARVDVITTNTAPALAQAGRDL
ncbi:MAG: hypothetical protein AUH85_12400 [Chloroflexi bacterium 13_1_40CM_4_68_4]|nr:MAG: hypothetical protein AUH85_12400 [Chloroflexi bacterium 13_1_40CM_4_68_4]